MNVIEVSNLTKKYKNLEAVKGISFQVKKGEVFGILGPNGAGKTTTLEILECLKVQTTGVCTILGFDNLGSPFEVKSRIGVQLQNSEYLNNLNLAELLRLFAGLYGKKINAKELLEKVDLSEKAKSQVKELSGGQKQRFTIASALVHTPEIIFLDEPTTGLDPAARHNMWQLVKDMNASGITVVITTHYMEEAEYLCNRIAILDQGKILKIGDPKKLISEISKVYKLSFFVDRKVDEELFKNIPGIDNLYNEYPKIVMDIEHPDILSAITEKLKSAGVQYSFLNLRTATLEDVYLKLTGHEYEE